MPDHIHSACRFPPPGNIPAASTRKYERAGTASVLMFCEPLAGWRQVEVSDRRTLGQGSRAVAADTLCVGPEGEARLR